MQIPGSEDVIDKTGVHHSTGVPRVNAAGDIVGSDYTPAEVAAALRTHRTQDFRYELHRLDPDASGGAMWSVLFNDIADKVVGRTARIEHSYWGGQWNQTFRAEIIDPEQVINYLTDVTRVFWRVLMPDGNRAEWMMGSYHVPDPRNRLARPYTHRIESHDVTELLSGSKLSDWFKVPSPSTPSTFGHPFDDGDPLAWARAVIKSRYPNAGVDITPNTAIRIPDVVGDNQVQLNKPGLSLLDVVNRLLLFCNYEFVHADPTGSFIATEFTRPSLRTSEWTYAADDQSIIIFESGEIAQDKYNAPNEVVRVRSRPNAPNLRSRLTIDDSPTPGGGVTHPLSIASRHRTVTDYEEVEAPDQATLDTMVQRRVEDIQRLAKMLTLRVPLMPHGYWDRVTVTYTGEEWDSDVNGDYMVTGWTFPCAPDGEMDLTLEAVPLFAAGTPESGGGS